jgi:hypothetical protein
MGEIKREKLKLDECYLVFMGYDWSPSGYDIGNYELSGILRSQSNGDDLLGQKNSSGLKIYELPVN